ncbi:MAG: CoA transferase, partial [Burkholderiaceae bacterium]|nr:CoA transferase [Burkholderiaceae bacterium]
NWRPGVAARLGLGYDDLRAIKPDIIFCSISGFGQKGPQSHRPAYAPIVHAASGFDLAQVEYQGGGKPQNTATYTADVFGGMSAFGAIQSALFQRERTGVGQYIDVSLLDGMLNILVAECQEWQAPTPARARVYPPLQASDGFIVIAPTSQKNFEGLVKVIRHEEWLKDPRFVSTVAREKNWGELMSLIEDWTRQHTSADCEKQLVAMGVPCTRYQTVAQAMSSEQIVARGSLTRIEDPAGAYLVPGAPFQMPGVHAAPRRGVPALGADGEAVLARFAGLSPEQTRACAQAPHAEESAD